MLRVFRALPDFNGDYALQAWIERIATNVCLDALSGITPPGAPRLRVSGKNPKREQVVGAGPAPRAHPLALEAAGDHEIDVVFHHP